MSSARTRYRLALLGFALLLVALRLALASSGANTFGRGEEFVRGAMAFALSDNLELPLSALFYHHYEGGSFVHGLFTAVAFELLGPSLLAHKLIAIAWELGLLAAGCHLCRVAFGRRAALYFAGLLILSPLAFQKLALLNLGIHYQALTFQFLLAALCLRIAAREPRGWLPLAAGLVGGFGLFYNYQLAPLIGLFGLRFLVARDLDPKGWLRLVSGFLIGALPLIAMAFTVGSGVLDIHGQALGEAQVDTRSSLRNFAFNLSAALGPRGWLQLLLLGLLPFAGLARAPLDPDAEVTDDPGPSRPEHARRAQGLLLAYLAVFALVVVLSGFFTAGFHDYFGAMRYAPFFGFACVLSAGCLARWSSAPGPRWLGPLVLALLYAAGASSFLSGVGEGGRGFGAGLATIAKTRGTDFSDYYAKVSRHFEAEPIERLALFTSLPSPPRKDLYEQSAEAVFRHQRLGLGEILGMLHAVDPERWRDFLPGLGAWAMRGKGTDMHAGRMRIFFEVRKLELDETPAAELSTELFRGLGAHGTGLYPTEAVLRDELNQLRDWGMPSEVYEGFGRRCFRAYFMTPERVEELVGGRTEEVARMVRRGFAQAVAEHAL